MKEMEAKIIEEGKVLPGGILKVGSFLNQQIDTSFLRAMALEIERLFSDAGVTKILTIESSGIALAAAVGLQMEVPVVFAKKHKSSNVDGDVYGTGVHSFTHNADYQVVVSRDYIAHHDRILLVDDFLANGEAMKGLLNICNQAGADVVGIAVAIEKCFQGGGDSLRALGYRVEALGAIESMDDGKIVFRK